MKENPFGKPTSAEAKSILTKRLGEGASTGWEKEQIFSSEEVVSLLKGLVPNIGNIQITEQHLNAEGKLVALYMRAEQAISGYSYMLKGKHGRSFTDHTMIERIDYTGPDSEEVEYAEVIAEFKDGEWVKQ